MFANTIASPAKRALEELIPQNLLTNYYLAGGTGASIQIGHRISVDLDFFSEKKVDVDAFINQLQDSKLSISNLEKNFGTVKFELAGAQVSFFEYPYPLISPLIGFEGINIAELMDIALMKIVAIANRGSKKDFIDLYMICQKYPIENIFDAFKIKYKKMFNSYQFIKALTYFADADLDPDPNMIIEWNWGRIKKFFADSAVIIH